jgi:hypothetical protein
MTGNYPVKGFVGRRNGETVGFGLWLLSLSLLAASMAGCQKAASTAEAPAVQPPSEAAVPATPSVSAEPKPAPSRMRAIVVKPGESDASGGQPTITVEKDLCDLGDVAVNTKHKGQFKFTNSGNAPLKITRVESCCGVVTKGVVPGQEYAPGQSGALEFDYQAPDTSNPALVRKLYLQTNDPKQIITTLTIKAAVVRRIVCKPEFLKLVSRQPNAGCLDITLSSLDGRPFSITDVKATGGAITAAFDPTEKATDFTLKPKVDIAKLEQNMRGQISIDLTHPDCNNVRVMYDTLPEFEISTPTIMMFGLRAGQAVQREFWILNNYQDDFEIESVSSQKGTVKLVEKTKVNNRYQLRVEVTPPERGRDSTVASDTLEIKIKNGRTLSIPFRGFYQDK